MNRSTKLTNHPSVTANMHQLVTKVLFFKSFGHSIVREFRLYMDFDILTIIHYNGPVRISKSIYSLKSRARHSRAQNMFFNFTIILFPRVSPI